MIMRELFSPAPLIALAVGMGAGLGYFRSQNWAVGLTGIAVVGQIVLWMILAVTQQGPETGGAANWNVPLDAGFFLALVTVLPCTIIGSTVTAGTISLVRHWRKR